MYNCRVLKGGVSKSTGVSGEGRFLGKIGVHLRED